MENVIKHETVINLFNDHNIDLDAVSAHFQHLIEVDARYIRDLKINVGNALKSQHINPKESYLLAYAVAVNEGCQPLMTAFESKARAEGAADEEIAEVVAGVSLMKTNNVFYRFRHFMHDNTFYQNQPAGIKMTLMLNPVLGKEFFELLSLVVSALNGCELCVTSHEASVKQHGASESRIFDAVKLGAVIKGFTGVF